MRLHLPARIPLSAVSWRLSACCGIQTWILACLFLFLNCIVLNCDVLYRNLYFRLLIMYCLESCIFFLSSCNVLNHVFLVIIMYLLESCIFSRYYCVRMEEETKQQVRIVVLKAASAPAFATRFRRNSHVFLCSFVPWTKSLHFVVPISDITSPESWNDIIFYL